MRHQTQPEQMTRLLIQKPAAYAELEENARIAVSVLQDDGWDVQRVGLDLRISVTTVPVAAPDQSALLAEAQAKLTVLRKRMMQIGIGVPGWAGLAFCVGAVLNEFGLGRWALLPGAFLIALAFRIARNVAKGAA